MIIDERYFSFKAYCKHKQVGEGYLTDPDGDCRSVHGGTISDLLLKLSPLGVTAPDEIVMKHETLYSP